MTLVNTVGGQVHSPVVMLTEQTLVKDKGLVHGTYYPLYSRIEVKAKIPYEFGTWMALWLRHCNGASTFEIDYKSSLLMRTEKMQ